LWTVIQKMNKDPKLFKISLIIQSITRKFQNSYLPEENISTDGSITSWKGRLNFQWYIPLKASKFGRRHMNYVSLEQDTCAYRSWKGQSVWWQFERLKNCFQTWGYTLYMDTFYNSQHLASLIKKSWDKYCWNTEYLARKTYKSVKSAEMKKGECDMTWDLFQRRLAYECYEN
jgi:hypothetical protein